MIKIPSKNISKLNLSNCNLTEIPAEVFELKNLKKLNLSGNKIEKIPKDIEKLNRLETLDLSNNKIKIFYSKLCNLSKLKVLNLNNNGIKTIPKQIYYLENLRVLTIAGNQLVNLTIEISRLKNLEELNIANNNLKVLPAHLHTIPTLKRIWIKGNRIEKTASYHATKLLLNIKVYDGFSESTSYENPNEQIKDHEPVDKFIQSESEMKKSIKKNKLFISYSHNDLKWFKLVKKHLKVLRLDNTDLEVWEDTKIKTGSKWKEEIDKALKDSGIAILIISTNFLASDFIRNDELPILLNNAEESGTKILPLIVAKSRFSKNEKLKHYQAVNPLDRPLNSLKESEIDEILLKLTEEVESIINL